MMQCVDLATHSYFTSGEFSDLTVKCKSDVYRAHKVVVCSQSQFFKAACSGGFKVRN